jgi:hypothetical protein
MLSDDSLQCACLAKEFLKTFPSLAMVLSATDYSFIQQMCFVYHLKR